MDSFTQPKLITKKKLIFIFAWLQLIISVAIATTVVWGYMTYRASVGQFAQSVAASIVAVSNVVGRTAETIEAKQSLIDQSGKTLFATRDLVKALQVAARNQAKIAPQYAEGVRGAADLVSSLSSALKSTGSALMFSVPSDIEIHKWQTKIIRTRPLEKQAREFTDNANHLQKISSSLLEVSISISRDGQILSESFIATSEQAVKLLDETEKTLGKLKSDDLPKALKDLKETSENLRNVSKQVGVVGNVSEVFLIVGLLLAAWCFFNSLSLMLINSRAVGSTL